MIKIVFRGKPDPKVYSVEEFEQAMKVKYLSHLEFVSAAVKEKVKGLCERAHKLGKVSLRAQKVGQMYGREIDGGFVNDVYIKWIDGQIGYGLFAGRKIDKGAFIGEYVGVVRRITRYFSSVNEYCFRYPLYNRGLFVYTIDPHDCCNETSFMNHSDTPNCESVVAFKDGFLHVCIIAVCDIKKDEQLTYDYGNDVLPFVKAKES